MNIYEKLRERGYSSVPESFYEHIKTWSEWYRGNVEKFHSYTVFNGMSHVRCRRYTMGMAKKVAEDWADLLMNEKVSVTLEGEREQAFFDQVCRDNNFAVKMNEMQELKAAMGTTAYVVRVAGAAAAPSGELSGGELRLDYCTAGNIYPLSWDNGRVRECAFTAHRAEKGEKYLYMQVHRLAGDGTYDIENVLYRDQNGSLTEVPLGSLQGLANVPPLIHTHSGRPQFVLDRLNIANNLDPALPMGVSVYANAIDQLKGVDIAYDSYVNEFVLGKKRIIVKPEATKTIDGEPLFDANDTVYYVLPEDGGDAKPVEQVDMTLRTAEHNAGMQDMLNALGAKCGFGENRYRFNQGGVTTATQVISENSAMFRAMRRHEIVLEDVLTELARIILRTGNSYLHMDLKEDVEISIDFDDSIIEDKDKDFARTLQLLDAGLMSPWEARARLMNEDEATAKSSLPGMEELSDGEGQDEVE